MFRAQPVSNKVSFFFICLQLSFFLIILSFFLILISQFETIFMENGILMFFLSEIFYFYYSFFFLSRLQYIAAKLNQMTMDKHLKKLAAVKPSINTNNGTTKKYTHVANNEKRFQKEKGSTVIYSINRFIF